MICVINEKEVMTTIHPLFVGITTAMACAVAGLAGNAAPGSGAIAYDKYPGKATIIKIEKTPISKTQGWFIPGVMKSTTPPAWVAVPYEGYEVLFTYQPDKPVQGELATDFASRTNKFLLLDGCIELYPGDKYIERYGIKAGKIYPCTMEVIKTGCATPCAFDIQGLDKHDVFEKKDAKKVRP